MKNSSYNSHAKSFGSDLIIEEREEIKEEEKESGSKGS